jgi:hypothetical protein
MITFLLALLTLTVLFIVFWAIFTPDDENASYRQSLLIGTKGGKAKKDAIEDDTIIEDDLV